MSQRCIHVGKESLNKAAAASPRFSELQDKMKKIIIAVATTLIAFLVFPPPSLAKIGWTLSQCRQYYGPESPRTPGMNSDTYEFDHAGGPHTIIVRIYHEKVASIVYGHKNPNVFAFTNAEIKELLFENANGYVWTWTGSNQKEVDYSAHLDGKVTMQAWYAKGGVYIMTSELLATGQ